MQGNGVGKSKGCRTIAAEAETRSVSAATEPFPSAFGANPSPTVLGMCAAALSGAIVGFLLSGAFSLAGITFISVVAGTALGWIARGLSR